MLEIPLPILFHRQPPSKLASYESRISLAGDPKKQTSAKVVLEDIEEKILMRDLFGSD
jgi:hypothetical protein